MFISFTIVIDWLRKKSLSRNQYSTSIQLLFNLSSMFFRSCRLKHTWKINVIRSHFFHSSNTLFHSDIYIHTHKLCTYWIHSIFFLHSQMKRVNKNQMEQYIDFFNSATKSLSSNNCEWCNYEWKEWKEKAREREATSTLAIYSFNLFSTCTLRSFNKRFGILSMIVCVPLMENYYYCFIGFLMNQLHCFIGEKLFFRNAQEKKMQIINNYYANTLIVKQVRLIIAPRETKYSIICRRQTKILCD